MKKWAVSILVIIMFCVIRFVDPWFLDMVRMKALDQHQRTQQETITDKIITVENKEFKLTLEDANALKKIYEDLNDVNKKEFELKLQTKIGTQQLISFASQWGE